MIGVPVKANEKARVAAVVVTFNRKQFLCECLDALLAQTAPLARIVLVDNASTDGTSDLLAEKGYLENGICTYVRLPINTGGAGGFHEGVKRAYEEGFDWMWLMDDDVEPVPHALSTMLAYSDVSRCIQACKVFENGDSEYWEQWASIQKSGSRGASKGPHHPQFIKAQTGCFEGMLIHRQTISAIGFPDPRFFIGCDDVAYGYLASKHTQVIYIRQACFVKKIRRGWRDHDLLQRLRDRFCDRRSPRFYFLSVRNELLLYTYICDAVKASRFHIRIVGLLLRYSIVTLVFERSIANCWALWRGTFQGYSLLISPCKECDVSGL
jgi:GT2 family glycosyltransferase